MQKKVKFALFLIVVANLAIVAVVFLGDRKSPPGISSSRPSIRSTFPTPNGYDSFVQAAGLRASIRDLPENPTRIELASYVALNGEALKLVRLGLRQECRVPLEYTTNDISRSLPLQSGFKALTTILANEGLLAEMRGDTNDASRIYVEITRFGAESSRDSLVVDHLLGLEFEDVGLSRLQRIVGSLNVAACQRAIQELYEQEVRRDPVAETWDRQDEWSRRAYGSGLKEKVTEMVVYSGLHHVNSGKAELEHATNSERRKTLLLMIDLATRAYVLDRGVAPPNIAALVPAYLREPPLDPFTHTNLSTAR